MSADDVHREEYRGYTIRLVPDPDPENPREEWDNVGTMRCWHRRYDLGDRPKDGWERDPEGLLRHLAKEADRKYRLWSGLMEAVEGRHFPEHQTYQRVKRHHDRHLQRALREHYRILPLYLLDHGDVALSTSDFGDHWDSGQVGYVFVDLAKAVLEFGSLLGTRRAAWDTQLPSGQTLGERLDEILRAEVRAYDAYLRGEVVGWVVENPDGEEVESVWGYYPDEEGGYAYVLTEARSTVDFEIEKRRRIEAETAACYI